MAGQDLTTQIRDRVIASIESASVFSDPYPHFQATELIPSHIYSRLLDAIPPAEHYQEVPGYGSEDSQQARFKFSPSDSNLERLTAGDREIWKAVRDALNAREVKSAVFRALAGGISYRFNIPEQNVNEVQGYPLLELYRETSGYSIKPHPDTRKKIVTFQITLPRDDSQADLGTSIYKLSVNPLKLFRHPSAFEEVKRAPFLPNCAFAFAVINTTKIRSWHGCEPLRKDCGTRNTLLQVYYADASMAPPEVATSYLRRAAA